LKYASESAEEHEAYFKCTHCQKIQSYPQLTLYLSFVAYVSCSRALEIFTVFGKPLETLFKEHVGLTALQVSQFTSKEHLNQIYHQLTQILVGLDVLLQLRKGNVVDWTLLFIQQPTPTRKNQKDAFDCVYFHDLERIKELQDPNETKRTEKVILTESATDPWEEMDFEEWTHAFPSMHLIHSSSSETAPTKEPRDVSAELFNCSSEPDPVYLQDLSRLFIQLGV
jgi:hypothetical protein